MIQWLRLCTPNARGLGQPLVRELQNWYYFFLKCLLKLTSKTIWACSFLVGEVFINKFSFLNRYEAIQASYLLSDFSMYLSNNWSILSKLSSLLGKLIYNVLLLFFWYLVVIGSLGMFPLSFLKLITYIFPFFPLISLTTRVWSISLLFAKNQLKILLFFSIIFLFST